MYSKAQFTVMALGIASEANDSVIDRVDFARLRRFAFTRVWPCRYDPAVRRPHGARRRHVSGRGGAV